MYSDTHSSFNRIVVMMLLGNWTERWRRCGTRLLWSTKPTCRLSRLHQDRTETTKKLSLTSSQNHFVHCLVVLFHFLRHSPGSFWYDDCYLLTAAFIPEICLSRAAVCKWIDRCTTHAHEGVSFTRTVRIWPSERLNCSGETAHPIASTIVFFFFVM